MICARDVVKSYGGRRVLGPVTLSFEAGAVTALVGGNGAGKSTLLRILSGATAPSSGRVAVGGAPAGIGAVRQARAAGVWMADQEGSLIPAWRVEEHFRRLAGLRSGEPWRLLVPSVRGRTFIRDLPQVERQLIEVALVCAGGTSAALFDEPTAGQGLQEKRAIVDALRRAAAAGAAVVWVTHDLDAALAVADRIVALRGGTVAFQGAAADSTKAAILAAFPAADRPAGPAPGAPPAGVGDTRLRLGFNRRGDDEIEVKAGEIVGLTSNSTSRARGTLRLAAGLGGRHRRFVEFTDPADRRRLAYMSRERDLDWDFPRKSLRFNLTAGMLGQLAHAGVIDARRERQVAEELRRKFRVEATSLDTGIEQLSGGNRQKALLARLASMKPRILLLDEPFSGVDAPTRIALKSELRQIAGEGTAIVIYSQEWDDLIQAVDRLVLVRDDDKLVSLPAASMSAAHVEAILGHVPPLPAPEGS